MTENKTHALIEETSDYSIFNRHQANRKTNEKLVNRMIGAIEKKNLLPCKPIIVDKQYNVIDGQHRLEAAKRLGLPISFVISDDVNVKDMQTFNTNVMTWGLDDYLNFHCNQDAINYQMLADFMQRENVKLNIAIQLLHGCRNPEFFKEFKDGLYKYPERAEEMEALVKRCQIQEVITFIKTKTSGPKTYLDKVTFYSAMIEFFNAKSFSYETFVQKMQYHVDMIHPCTRQGDYLRMFRDIYNFKNRSPIQIGD